VGLPRLSRICRAVMSTMVELLVFLPENGGVDGASGVSRAVSNAPVWRGSHSAPAEQLTGSKALQEPPILPDSTAIG
jgi:hypothetical protein